MSQSEQRRSRRAKLLLYFEICNTAFTEQLQLNNPEVRLRQYREALDWYLDHTDMKILLVENSGTDFSSSYQKQIGEGRLEFLCFDGNNYDRSRGKGYGEAAIMEYGIAHSHLLKSAPPKF